MWECQQSELRIVKNHTNPVGLFGHIIFFWKDCICQNVLFWIWYACVGMRVHMLACLKGENTKTEILCARKYKEIKRIVPYVEMFKYYSQKSKVCIKHGYVRV